MGTIIGTAVITAIVTAIVTAICNGLSWSSKKLKRKMEQQQETNEVLRKGVQALLRDRLYDIHHTATRRGYITETEFTNFRNLYQQYHDLGKNGVMDDYNEEVKRLPRKDS